MVNSFTPITTLRYWCQKVIPLVYEDSLSYYELLSKVVGKINELIVNNNELPELIVEQIQEMLDSDTIEEIVKEFLEENEGIVFDDDLTSNDIDVQCMFNYIYDDGRIVGGTHYCVIQSMCVMPNGNFIGIFSNENGDTNTCKIREFDTNGNLVREKDVQGGHGQACCTDGENIYIGYMSEIIGGNKVDSNKINVVEYSSLNSIKIIYSPVPTTGLAYNYDEDTLIVTRGDKMYEILKDSQVVIREVTMNQKIYASTQARQDAVYYKGMVGQIFNFPNLLCFYDIETGELVKMYNLTDKANTGVPITEIESGQYYNGEIVLCAFSRLGDGKKGYNNIVKINPWKNVYNTYAKKNRYSGLLTIYVDGDVTSPIQDGSIEHPFQNIGLACSVINSWRHKDTPLNINIKGGTSVGFLGMQDVSNINFNIYDVPEKFVVDGLRFMRVSNFRVANCRIVRNNNAESFTGLACGYVAYSNGVFEDCEIQGDGNEIGLYFATCEAKIIGSESGKVTSFDNVTDCIRLNHSSRLYRSRTSMTNYTNSVRCYNQSYETSVQRIKSKSVRMQTVPVPNIMRYDACDTNRFRLGTFSLDNANVDNYVVDGSVEGINYLVLTTYWDNVFQSYFVPINATGISDFEINLCKLRGSNHQFPQMASIIGHYDLAEKTLEITDIVGFNLDTKQVYHLKDGDTGLTYPYIQSFNLI